MPPQKATDDQLRQARTEGLSTVEIAQRFGYSPKSIQHLSVRLKYLGVNNPPGRPASYGEDQVRAAAATAENPKQLAHALGCTPSTARALIRRYNLSIPITPHKDAPACSPPSSPTSDPPTSAT